MSISDVSQAPDIHFRAVLLPQRSLGRNGFALMMICVSAICLIAGLVFFMLGAWPVAGFLGLDVLLIYAAFRYNYSSARLYEKVELSENELRVTRVHPSGQSESWSYNPYWVQLELKETAKQQKLLGIRSHGKVLNFGRFLTDDEKISFANALDTALQKIRGPKI